MKLTKTVFIYSAVSFAIVFSAMPLLANKDEPSQPAKEAAVEGKIKIMGKEVERKFLVKKEVWKPIGTGMIVRQGYLPLSNNTPLIVKV